MQIQQMKDEDFKIEVLRLLCKISNQLDGRIYVASLEQAKKKSISKMSNKELRETCINDLVKTLGPNILNYINR